jgi:hypothetical protein
MRKAAEELQEPVVTRVLQGPVSNKKINKKQEREEI